MAQSKARDSRAAPRSSALGALATPRYATAWAALVYIVATLILAYPALVGRFLVNPASDQYIGGYAFREFAAASLRAGHGFPLWNPYLFGGMPYVAAMSGDIFYPTFLMRMIMPTDVAMTWAFIIHIILAGFFTYLFLRICRFSFFGALTGGLIYMMGGPISSYVSPGHDGKLYVSALLPLVLYVLVRGIRDGKAWSWGALALVTGLACLSPHPQLFQYMLLLCGAFALWLAFGTDNGSSLERRVAVKRLGAAMLAVIVGTLMGAIQYTSVFQYVPWSPRAGGLSGWDHATSYSFPPEELINTYIPQFTGMFNHYWGRNGIHLHSEYLGAVALVLALLGVVYAWRPERRSFGRFWFVTFIVALLWTLGGFTPFYHIVYALIPGTKYFRAPSTMVFVVGLCVAIFAALGAERLERGDVTRQYAVGWLVAAGVVLLLGATGMLTNLALTLAPPEHQDGVSLNAPLLLVGAVRTAIFSAAAAGLLLALVMGRAKRAVVAWAVLALAAADLWSIEHQYWIFSAPAAQIYAANATTDYVRKQPVPGRVLQLPADAAQSPYVPHDSYLFGNALMVQGIRTVMGYHGNEIGRYHDLINARLTDPQLWRLLNVRYLLTNLPSIPDSGFTKVVGPTPDAAGTTTYLYTVPGDDPPAWVAPVIVKAADTAVLVTVLDQRFDIRRAALFDTSAAVQGQKITALPEASTDTATVTRYDPGHIEVNLAQPAPHGSALIVSENYYPGWVATADGKPATVGRADYILIGVALPDGAKHVDLMFTSPVYERGKMITIVATLLALLLLAAGLIVDKKRNA
ncbi:MAG TPA: YfhO family protein [Gemmatimonadaceae bacterium]|nr:YfhO family protein [Gemmatimonadaceae bacterium]